MIYAYGVSLPGTYHVEQGIVCQDSHKIIVCGNLAVAAVADGLGSAKFADVGSKIASNLAVKYCREHIENSDILEIIRAAFYFAQKAVEKEAADNNHDVAEYDTTLTLAVLDGDTLYYGHSGDSGMIALTTAGLYEQVTEQQRDEEGRVFPLFFTDKWQFAQFEQKVASVFLATDGMLETFFPIYIKNEPVKIHISLARFFMDNKLLRIDKAGQENVQARMESFLESIPGEQVNDDKTVVALINTSVKTKRQPRAYYKEPDWEELKRKYDEAWRREAYPGLF